MDEYASVLFDKRNAANMENLLKMQKRFTTKTDKYYKRNLTYTDKIEDGKLICRVDGLPITIEIDDTFKIYTEDYLFKKTFKT